MKAKRKRRMSRRRRERTYIAVMVLLAIAVSIGLTRSVMRDDKEFEEFEQQLQEFDARMQRIDEKREAWEKVHREVDSARQKELQICSQDGYSTLFRER